MRSRLGQVLSWLKSHARGVAHGIVANFIFWLLTLGVGGAISYVTAHSALVYGLPTYEALMAGAATFLVLALGVYLVTLARGAWLREYDNPTSGQTEIEKTLIKSQARVGELEQQIRVMQSRHADEPVSLSPGQAANDARLLQADTSFTSEVRVQYKSKLRCEFQNDADRSINVRTSTWTPGASGIQARVLKATLQILIEDYWCPPNGANELDVPPSGRFRTWIGLVVSENLEAEVKRWIAANALGTIELIIDGRKVQWRI